MACTVFGAGLWGGDIISPGDTDIFLEFYHMRGFTARELLAGNIPLWNPHIYSGSPFLMDPETGIFYPLNWVFLLLPTTLAINTSVILHLTLLGILTFLWVRHQQHIAAVSFASGMLAMFSGAYFMHTYAGHLGILSTAAWTPLVLAALDRNAEKWRSEWLLVGFFAAGMSFLAGHLQYVIISATASALYALFLAVERRQIRTLWCVPCWYGGGVFLGAVQAFPAVDGLSESYRAALTDSYLASFSFHPENLLTLVAPDFFGNMDTVPYWGKEYLWEQSIFLGVGSLFLIIYGMRDRSGKLLALASFLVLLIALGVHTPLFAVTSRHVLFLNKLRGHGKFIFGATILLVPLMAHGASRLWKERPSWCTIGMVAGSALVAGGAAYAVGNAYSLEEWRALMWSLGPATAGSRGTGLRRYSMMWCSSSGRRDSRRCRSTVSPGNCFFSPCSSPRCVIAGRLSTRSCVLWCWICSFSPAPMAGLFRRNRCVPPIWRRRMFENSAMTGYTAILRRIG